MGGHADRRRALPLHPLSRPRRLKPGLLAIAEAQGVKGSLLLAPEGINGTIAGPRDGIDAVLAAIRGLPGCAGLEWKESPPIQCLSGG
jgi:UPF0176 protein